MRRKPNIKLKEFCRNNYCTIKELLVKVNKKFNENYKENELRKYLVRNKIPYKYEMKQRSHPMGVNTPIGSEYIKDDGMILVKVGRNQWKYKQRLIYEQHYGVKLKEDEFIIFLNQDRTDFSINNIMKVSRQESSYLKNYVSSDREITKTAVELARLLIKIKESL